MTKVMFVTGACRIAAASVAPEPDGAPFGLGRAGSNEFFENKRF
jgi:hypothetical protein